jgi:NUMOD1 domain
MRIARLGKPLSEATKLKLSANYQAFSLTVKNCKTGEVILFTSIRKAAKFIGIHHSYIAKCLNKNSIFIGKGYNIVKSN